MTTHTDDGPAPDSPQPSLDPQDATPVRRLDAAMGAARTTDARVMVLTEHTRALTEQVIRTRNDLGAELNIALGLIGNMASNGVDLATENHERHLDHGRAFVRVERSIGALAEQIGGVARELAAIRSEAAAERAARVRQDSVHDAEITGMQRTVTATASDLAVVRAKSVGLKGLGWAAGIGLLEALKYLLSHLG